MERVLPRVQCHYPSKRCDCSKKQLTPGLAHWRAAFRIKQGRGCSACPEYWLPAIDRLEGFRPGRPSLYRHVLAPVTLGETVKLACLYAVADNSIKRDRIVSGRWPE